VDGAADVAWTDAGELLTVMRDASPLRRILYLRPRRDRIVRWSRNGRRLATSTFEGAIDQLIIAASGQQLAAVATKNGFRVVELERGAPKRELLSAPPPSQFMANGVFLALDYIDSNPRVWRIADGLQELQRVSGASLYFYPRLFGANFYPETESLVRVIETRWPVPRGVGERVGYNFAFDVRWIFAVTASTSATGAKLYVTDVRTKEWKLITAALALAPVEVPRASVIFYDLSAASTAFAAQSGIALYAERAGGRIVHRLYDATTGATATLLDRPADDRGDVEMHATRIDTPPAISVSIQAANEPAAGFLWRDGRLEPVPSRPGGVLLALWPDGTQVRGSWQMMTVSDPKGSVRRVSM
jgi:hypothetical protein